MSEQCKCWYTQSLSVKAFLLLFITLAAALLLATVAKCQEDSNPPYDFKIRVLQSTLKLENAHSGLSGAKLNRTDRVSSAMSGLSICLRVNYQRFSAINEPVGRSQIVRIADWKEQPEVIVFILAHSHSCA